MNSLGTNITHRYTIEEKVLFLKDRNNFPDHPKQLKIMETHMSWVFLTERHAYKLKKPIRYDVLDFSTLALRHRSCRRELRLNRRLAPQVYLGLVSLNVDERGALRLGGAGPAVDWLVKMIRLPAERMLDHVIAEGRVRQPDVEPAAKLLADFYRQARSATVDGRGYRTHLRDGVLADRAELVDAAYGLPAETVLRVADAQLRILEDTPDLFDRRVEQGRVVEGHGDLRPEHVCLVDPPAIIDCLEFSRDLRIQDPADELSFLALECERLGAPVVGHWFFDVYRDVTGDDPAGDLLEFYRGFRALRRAKIAIWHLREPDLDHAEQWRERAEWYLAAADPASGQGQA